MKLKTKTTAQGFNKSYSVAIDTVPLPENLHERIRSVVDQVTPVTNQIVTDAQAECEVTER